MGFTHEQESLILSIVANGEPLCCEYVGAENRRELALHPSTLADLDAFANDSLGCWLPANKFDRDERTALFIERTERFLVEMRRVFVVVSSIGVALSPTVMRIDGPAVVIGEGIPSIAQAGTITLTVEEWNKLAPDHSEGLVPMEWYVTGIGASGTITIDDGARPGEYTKRTRRAIERIRRRVAKHKPTGITAPRRA